MKAYCIDHFGSVEGVLLQSRADPQPGRREILVRVRATSLDYRDLMVLKGGGRGPTKVGVVPLRVPARLSRSAAASRGSRLEIGSSVVFTRAGLAARSRRIT